MSDQFYKYSYKGVNKKFQAKPNNKNIEEVESDIPRLVPHHLFRSARY